MAKKGVGEMTVMRVQEGFKRRNLESFGQQKTWLKVIGIVLDRRDIMFTSLLDRNDSAATALAWRLAVPLSFITPRIAADVSSRITRTEREQTGVCRLISNQSNSSKLDEGL